MRTQKLATIILTATLASLGLTGCGDTGATAGGTPATTPSAGAVAASALTVKDPWVKASKAGVMTAAFGVLVNDTDADVTLRGAESPASPMELHEMTMKDGKMIMRPKEGGFVIKAKSTHELGPGGDHLMLMKPAQDIEAGDEVAFTLALAGGAKVEFKAIAKPFAGAGESYDPSMQMPSSGMPMSPMAK
ncbi:copper chaperone PCu(A)C [Actinoplanes sp. NPDC051470]|uniref:copper chaperone PCu(A)C n=1 Tax=Actinoplanes sp. NPDC051470 TaxID=3157224 RepID=UPI00341BCD95